MPNFTPLEKIKLDHDPNVVKMVINPTNKDFECLYGGKPQILKSGESRLCPEPLANHIAKHLADMIVRDRSIELLQSKFKGLDETGREKWKVNEQIIITRLDIDSVKKCLVFDPSDKPEMKSPKTRFDVADKPVVSKPVEEPVEDVIEDEEIIVEEPVEEPVEEIVDESVEEDKPKKKGKK